MDLGLPGHQNLPLGHLNEPAAFVSFCSLRDMFNLWEFVLVESRFQLVPVDFIVTVAVSCWNCVYRAGEKSRRDAPRAWFFELFPGSQLFLFICVLSSVVEGYGG